MVVDDLDIVGAVDRPAEADAPLIIDPDAPLPLSVSLEFLQSIAGEPAQVGEVSRSLQGSEAPRGRLFDVSKPSRAMALKQGLGVFAAEASNRGVRLGRCT